MISSDRLNKYEKAIAPCFICCKRANAKMADRLTRAICPKFLVVFQSQAGFAEVAD